MSQVGALRVQQGILTKCAMNKVLVEVNVIKSIFFMYCTTPPRVCGAQRGATSCVRNYNTIDLIFAENSRCAHFFTIPGINCIKRLPSGC